MNTRTKQLIIGASLIALAFLGLNAIRMVVTKHSMQNAAVTSSISSPFTAIDAGASWKYLDNGTDQGTSWRAAGFNDGSWKSGTAEFGYGDGDEKTKVGYGSDIENKYVTTYFRKTFNVSDISSVTGLVLKLKRDDGAVVYLNGSEIYRTNMPTGTVGYKTYAADAIEDETWRSRSVSPSLLKEGTNTIAVELHQGTPSSSDTSFDLSLSGTKTTSTSSAGVTAPVPKLTLTASPTTVSSGGSSKLSWILDPVDLNADGVVDGTDYAYTDMAVCSASGAWGGSVGNQGTKNTGALTSSKTYTITCESFEEGTFDPVTKSVTVSVAATAPTPIVIGAPNNLTATPVSSTQINLSWNDRSSNEAGFSIERKTGASGTFVQVHVTGANATTYANTGLSANTTYYYKIEAVNGADSSTYSEDAAATTLGTTVPTPVPVPTPTPTPVPAPTPTPTPTPPITSGCPSGAITITPADSIQAKVDANVSTAAFCIKAGTYYQSVVPKTGNKFYGETGAIISGAKVLTGAVLSGTTYKYSNQTQRAAFYDDGCKSTYPRCKYGDDVFFDDKPLMHVSTLAAVGPGKYYFDYTNSAIYLGDNPSGHKVEVAQRIYAFSGGASDVVINGLTVEKFGNRAGTGAIGGYTNVGSRWTVENNLVQFNHGGGIFQKESHIARNNRVNNNGQLGITGEGNNILAEKNEIAYNNYAGYSTGWEAGGTKWVHTDNLLIRLNYVHHNKGPGLWTDIRNINSVIECNIVVDNDEMGIFHEISYAAKIRNNVVKNNAVNDKRGWLYSTQILSSTSEGAEIYNNIVEIPSYGNAIGVIQQSRDERNAAGGEFRSKNNYVHDNKITFTTDNGTVGAAADYLNSEFWSTGNNRFANNKYSAPSLSAYHWEWLDKGMTWNTYKAYETGATADTTIVKNTTPLGVPTVCPVI